MENLTHSLVGASLAELMLPAGASTAQRRVYFGLGVIAANLPDADLLYTRITAAPLGYLLHHRGHTHTLAGIAGLAVLVGIVCHLVPSIRSAIGRPSGRLWGLLALALLSHLVLDSWNSYGIHPFWPLESRWFYGDVIYIAEPWLWLFLGVAAVINTRNHRGRIAFGAALTLLVGGLAAVRMLPVAPFVALVAGAAVLVPLVRGRAPRVRAALALALTATFVSAMFGLRARAEAAVLGAPAPGVRGRVLDVVLSPQPANPSCWSALVVSVDDASRTYALTRASVAATPWSMCGNDGAAPVGWAESSTQSLNMLGQLFAEDCMVRGWMQFGRAPVLGREGIADARYGGVAPDNFSMMPLQPATERSSCPRLVPGWGMPRADLLAAAQAAPPAPVLAP